MNVIINQKKTNEIVGWVVSQLLKMNFLNNNIHDGFWIKYNNFFIH
jgi:hypothetical protein